MAISFKLIDEHVKLYDEDGLFMELPLRCKPGVSGKSFLPKLTGTIVKEIPQDISFYIEDLPESYKCLSAIILDNSEKGISVTLRSEYINIGAWQKPFTFTEYFNKLESLLKDGSRFTSVGKCFSAENAIIDVKFFVPSGDLIKSIHEHMELLNGIRVEVESILSYEDPHFIEGTPCLLEEDASVEFKEVKSEDILSAIKKNINEYVIAFSNADGGSIYWGVADDGLVKGICLSSQLKDKIRLMFNSKIHEIYPTIDPTSIKILFHEVGNKENHFVIQAIVPKSNMLGLYYNNKKETWVRLNGSNQKLDGPGIEAYILKRVQNST